jgi:superfamily II DNA or RNA helicase
MISLRDYQHFAINSLAANIKKGIRKQILQLPTGAGKCHAKGTPILMYDGTIKKVEDVEVGDKIMGPDSTERNVLSLGRGTETMYKVTPIKGDPYIVNESHILSLRVTGLGKKYSIYNGRRLKTGDIVNVSILDYIKQNKTFKHVCKGWRTGVDFDYKDVDFDPYMLGIWLAEGTQSNTQITNPDFEVLEYVKSYAEKIGCKTSEKQGRNCTELSTIRLGPNDRNHFLAYLKKYDLLNNKHIPFEFKVNNRSVRLQVLAGLLDGDGHLSKNGYEIATKFKALNDDILFLARSLGFAAYSNYSYKTNTTTGRGDYYYRIYISGHTDEIPCKITRKQAGERLQPKNVLNVGIKVEKLDVDDYYGFELDGDHLYLLGDFTVTHNTLTISGLISRYVAKNPDHKILMLVHREELLMQSRKAMFNGFGLLPEAVTADTKFLPPSNIYVAMLETAYNRMSKNPNYFGNIDLLIIDECHFGGFKKIDALFPDSLIIGLTATPISATKKDPLNNYFDEIVCPVQIKRLIQDGSLVQNRTFSLGNIDRKKLKVSRGEFDNRAMGEVYKKERHVHNVVKAYHKIGGLQKTIVYNCNIEHSILVNDAFVSAGFHAIHIDGNESKHKRKEILDWFNKTPGAVLNSVGILTTGFDSPGVINIIMNMSTMSFALYIQIVGRGARPYPGKDIFNFIDMGGNAQVHGDWSDEVDWYDRFHYPDRPSKGGGVPPTRTCEGCQSMLHAAVVICPFCGHEREITARYDPVIDFEQFFCTIDVERAMEYNTEQGYKEFRVFYNLLGKALVVIRSRYEDSNLTADDLDQMFKSFEEKIIEWCERSGKKYNRWLKELAKASWDKETAIYKKHQYVYS